MKGDLPAILIKNCSLAISRAESQNIPLYPPYPPGGPSFGDGTSGPKQRFTKFNPDGGSPRMQRQATETEIGSLSTAPLATVTQSIPTSRARTSSTNTKRSPAEPES